MYDRSPAFFKQFSTVHTSSKSIHVSFLPLPFVAGSGQRETFGCSPKTIYFGKNVFFANNATTANGGTGHHNIHNSFTPPPFGLFFRVARSRPTLRHSGNSGVPAHLKVEVAPAGLAAAASFEKEHIIGQNIEETSTNMSCKTNNITF